MLLQSWKFRIREIIEIWNRRNMLMIWILSLIKIVCWTIYLIWSKTRNIRSTCDLQESPFRLLTLRHNIIRYKVHAQELWVTNKKFRKIDPCDILSKIAILCQPLFIAIFVLQGVLEPWVTWFYFLQEQWSRIPGGKNPTLDGRAGVCGAHTASTVFSPFCPKVTALPSGKSNIWEQCFVPKRIDAWESKLTSPAWFTLQEPCINDESGGEVKTKAHRYENQDWERSSTWSEGPAGLTPQPHTQHSPQSQAFGSVYMCVLFGL